MGFKTANVSVLGAPQGMGASMLDMFRIKLFAFHCMQDVTFLCTIPAVGTGPMALAPMTTLQPGLL